jgi:hypothetical protein
MGSEDSSYDSGLQVHDVEVQEEGDVLAAQPEVGHELRFVDGQHALDRLQLHDDRVPGDDVLSLVEVDGPCQAMAAR